MTDNLKPEYWQKKSNLDIGGLIAGLSSDDKLIRRRAALALRAMNATNALTALQKAYSAEKDPETGMVIANAIATLKKAPDETTRETKANDAPDKMDVKSLLKQINSENPEDIIVAAQELGDRGEKIAVESLILAFNNPKHTIHVRLAIAEALLKLESAPVEVALLANLRHTDWHIRRNGAAILGQLKAEWAVAPLSKTLNDPHPVVRRTALAALKHIGTPESRKALAKYVSETHQTNPLVLGSLKEVSGIEVKRPGKQDEQNESPLLKRLRKKREAEQRRMGTKPLDPSKIDSTRPIRGNMLDQLDALLDNSDDEG